MRFTRSVLWKFEAQYDFTPYETVVQQRYTKSCVQYIDHNAWVHHTMYVAFCVFPLHYSFVRCKIVLCFELPQHCTSESCAPCLHTDILRHTVTIQLEIFTVYPATQNLVLPLIWFHSVHSWPHTNLGKLTFETTLVWFLFFHRYLYSKG